MKAIILAAGRGERMRPLTDTTPKPLLRVHGKALIEWHLEALARSGVRELVINTAWFEQQIIDTLGDGSRFGVAIAYSREGRDHGAALETAGGLKKALPLLTDATQDCFWVVAGDVFVPGFEFDARAAERFASSGELAHLWLAPNPPHHPEGDFGIDDRGRATFGVAGERLTWPSIGLFRSAFVTELMAQLPLGAKAKLRPYLDAAIAQGRLGAELYEGPWADVGTPQRLRELNAASA